MDILETNYPSECYYYPNFDNRFNAIVNISYQNELNTEQFHSLKEQGIDAILHTATEGQDIKDAAYAKHKTLAELEGFLWGASHIGTSSSVDDQIKNFLDAVGENRDNVAFSLILKEYEDKALEMTKDQAKEFIDKIKDKTDHSPIVYGSYKYLESLLGNADKSHFNQYPLWIEDYEKHGDDPSIPGRKNQPSIPSPWHCYWTIWNYTDGEHGSEPHKIIEDINLDRSVFHGSKNQLQDFWKNIS